MYNLKIVVSTVLFTGMFGVILYLCLQGIFAEDIALPVRDKHPRHLVFVGYPKLLLCLSGMTMASTMLYIPIKAFINGVFTGKYTNTLRKDWFLNKLFTLIVAASFIGFIIAYIWQSLDNPIYR